MKLAGSLNKKQPAEVTGRSSRSGYDCYPEGRAGVLEGSTNGVWDLIPHGHSSWTPWVRLPKGSLGYLFWHPAFLPRLTAAEHIRRNPTEFHSTFSNGLHYRNRCHKQASWSSSSRRTLSQNQKLRRKSPN